MARPEVKEYLNHIEKVRRYSHHTVIAYRTDLKQFCDFYKGNLLNARQKDVRRYLIDLRVKNYSNRSINRKLEVLKSFYRFYRRFSDFKIYPCSFVKPLRYAKTRGNYIPVEKIQCTLNGIRSGTNRKSVRDKLTLELLYQTGCRAAEIINLKKEDIDWDRHQIKVFGKGRVERIIPINDRLMKLMKKHLKLWRDKNGGPYLLTNNKGENIYPMYLWRLIRKYFKPEIIEMNVSAHTFRHSCATHLYHNRAPIKAIRDLLGHRALRSTEPYLHLNVHTLVAIYHYSHPKSGLIRNKFGID